MKKQLIVISLVCSSFLLAAESFVNPLPTEIKAIEKGESLPIINAYNEAVGSVVGNGLIYDNCEGGSRTRTNAETYCSAKGEGWRLPTLNETNKGKSESSGVPECSSTKWSWTSTPVFENDYYVWSESSYNSGGNIGSYGVRCVKIN